MSYGICHFCSCIDENCSNCIEKTGQACYWVDSAHDLCSNCESQFIEGFSDSYFQMVEKVKPMILIIGNPFFYEEEFMELKPGDKVNKIGDKITGSAAINRFDDFVSHVTYKGILRTKMMSLHIPEILELLIFKVNPKDCLIYHDQTYLGYIILRASGKIQLKVPDLRYNLANIYQPVFNKIKK